MRVITGGVVHTMIPGARGPADAVAHDRGRIVAVGREAEVREAAGSGAEVVNLDPSQAVVPGFIDPHHHLSLGVLYQIAVDCRPQVARSIGAIQNRLRAAAAESPPEHWVVAYGYDELALAEGRHPTRYELDDAVDHRPLLLLHYSFHEGVVNSPALAAVGIDERTPSPPGGRIVRDRRGRPTGRLLETASSRAESLARRSLLDRVTPTYFERLSSYQHELFAVGITRLCDPSVPPEMEALYARARSEGHLRVPVIMMPVSAEGFLVPPFSRLDGPPTGEGDETLGVGPLKCVFDGGLHCALCLSVGQVVGALGRAATTIFGPGGGAMLRAMGDTHMRLGRDGKVRSGILYHTDDSARELMHRATERGFAVAVHAFGNAAIAQAARAIQGVRHRHPDRLPPRIEHAMVTEPANARAIADAGVQVVTQPAFLRMPAFASIPVPPGLRLAPLRSLLDAGVRLSGSSDAPVAEFAPLAGIVAAVTREGARGARIQPEEAIRPEEALAMYTREAARAAGSLEFCGTLEPGKRADLVVLSGDPIRAGPDALGRIAVVETILGGESVYSMEQRKTATPP